jgi:predicted aspartyl protease
MLLYSGSEKNYIQHNSICSGMGHVYVTARVENPLEGVSREYRFLANTGASYMVLRDAEFSELKLKPIAVVKFTLADGRTVEAPIAPVKVYVMDREAMVFATRIESPMPLLGAFTLEALGLAVDTSTGEVKPSRPAALLL